MGKSGLCHYWLCVLGQLPPRLGSHLFICIVEQGVGWLRVGSCLQVMAHTQYFSKAVHLGEGRQLLDLSVSSCPGQPGVPWGLEDQYLLPEGIPGLDIQMVEKDPLESPTSSTLGGSVAGIPAAPGSALASGAVATAVTELPIFQHWAEDYPVEFSLKLHTYE